MCLQIMEQLLSGQEREDFVVRTVEMFSLTYDLCQSHLKLLLIKLQMVDKPGGSQNGPEESSINILQQWLLSLKPRT